MKLANWLEQASGQLQQASIESARLDSELVASSVLARSRTWLHAHPEYQPTANEHITLDHLLKRRLNHEPIAYLIGSKEFYARDFVVNSDVLVPRPDSEDFINLLKNITENDLKFIDIGTGSGILAITIALEQPTWSGTATDISPKALKVAQINAEQLKAQNLVFKTQNLLANDSQNYDVVITNLPYVPKNLHNKPDIAHEPEIALFADHDGLAIYEKLFQQIATRTQKPAHILTESLLNQHKDLIKMAEAAGYRLNETKGLIQHFVPVS